MKTWKQLGLKGAAFGLCVACQSAPADPPGQVFKSYDASGELRQTVAVQNGQPNGPVVWYYPNGARKETARYMQGRPVGSKVLFDSTGKPSERHVYDTTGRLFFVRWYDKQGCPSSTEVI